MSTLWVSLGSLQILQHKPIPRPFEIETQTRRKFAIGFTSCEVLRQLQRFHDVSYALVRLNQGLDCDSN